MVLEFDPGDFLIFQLESGYALLRVLAVERAGDDAIWHITIYRELFIDPDSAESAVTDASRSLEIETRHVALTNRAFESTQVAKIGHRELGAEELAGFREWSASGDRRVSDRSVRLLLGLR